MTDLEINRLCAEAMGWTHVEDGPTKETIWSAARYVYPDGIVACYEHDYKPLFDDVQAMALLKKFRVAAIWIGIDVGWRVLNGNGLTGESIHLNRAICECVAKMQAAK